MKVRAQIRGKAIDVAAELEQGVLGRSARQRADGNADGLRFGPPAFTGPGVESIEILLVQVHLQRSAHALEVYILMTTKSIES